MSTGTFGTKEIKKAYRNKALKYHPDKTIADPDQDKVRERYQLLVKAYETLTDETKYNNWQKYGNPDGSLAFRAIEVALPSFLLEPEN